MLENERYDKREAGAAILFKKPNGFGNIFIVSAKHCGDIWCIVDDFSFAVIS